MTAVTATSDKASMYSTVRTLRRCGTVEPSSVNIHSNSESIYVYTQQQQTRRLTSTRPTRHKANTCDSTLCAPFWRWVYLVYYSYMDWPLYCTVALFLCMTKHYNLYYTYVCLHEMWIDKSEPENHLCDIWRFVTKYIDLKSFIYRYSFHLKMAAKFCIFMPRSGDMILNIIQMMHGSEFDIQIWWTQGWKCRTTSQPECDIFNRGSS